MLGTEILTNKNLSQMITVTIEEILRKHIVKWNLINFCRNVSHPNKNNGANVNPIRKIVSEIYSNVVIEN